MDTRMERLAVLVVPGLLRLVFVGDEHRLAVPVVALARQEVAALQQQDAGTARRQRMGERSPAGPGADDDDVVAVLGHGSLLSACRQHGTRGAMSVWHEPAMNAADAVVVDQRGAGHARQPR